MPNIIYKFCEKLELRNVVLLGHSNLGKTTYIETMLYEGGASQVNI